MDKKILLHFKHSDPILYSVFSKIQLPSKLVPRPPKKYFSSLCSIIVGQQLSGRVADVIFSRFQKLFPKGEITPKKLLKIALNQLRKSGLSGSKSRYLRDLADKVENGGLILSQLSTLKEEELTTELTKVVGIGPWSAEMFMIFTLGREDIFSTGDYGLKKAIGKIYSPNKELTAKRLQTISAKWKPYRSYASLVLWRYLDN